ncbi:hypothetical protein ACLKA6_018224 [Drosophila palustris]
MHSFKSIDCVTNEDEATNYPIEFLNSLDVPGLPPHYLRLKCSATGGQFYNLVDLAFPTIQLKIFVGSIFGVRRVITESRVLRWIIKHLTKRSSCGSCGYCQRIHLPLWQYPTGHVRHLFVTAGRGAALGYWSLCSAHSTHSFLVDWIVAEN